MPDTGEALTSPRRRHEEPRGRGYNGTDGTDDLGHLAAGLFAVPPGVSKNGY